MTIQTLAATALTFFSATVCSFAAADNGLLALVPGNSEFVVGINVTSSRDSELGQYLSAQMNSGGPGFEQLTAETGFDPKRDLESVLYAGVSSTSGTQQPAVVVLVRGTFDQAKIRSAAVAKGAVVHSFSGVDLYVHGGGRHRNAFAFVENDVFAMGSELGLQRVVANLSTPTPMNAQLQKLIAQAGTGNDIWFVSAVSASRLPMPMQPGTDDSARESRMLQTISSATGGIRFGSSVQITVDAVAQSDKDASSLADVVRFGASLIQARGQSDPNSTLLASALNQMLVSASGQNVHFSLSVPESTLEQLAEARGAAGSFRVPKRN